VGRFPGGCLNILISGATGYIGSYLVKKFLQNSFNTGIITRNQFAGFPAGVEIIHADLSTGLEYEPKINYDMFIHLAAANDIDSKNPVTALNDTVKSTLNALEFCAKNNIKKFIYFSTFQVYGLSSGYADENTAISTLNHYALTHYIAEKYVEFYNKSRGIDYIILRPTNIFGGMLNRKTDRWSLVPSCFCLEAFEKQQITLLSSGRQKRDFISLNNVCNAVYKFVEEFENNNNRVFNLGSGVTKTIYETAVLVKNIYEEKYKRKCELNILSDKPEVTEELAVSTEMLKAAGIDTSDNNIENEVIKIFDLLEEKGTL
jgi:nucleoside-diphosphate-sugar epimerase